MAVTFPDNPVLNESYQAENGLTYVWDGEKWSSQGSYNIDNDNYIRKDGTNTVVYADNLGMGVGTTSPSKDIHVVGTSGILVEDGNPASPSPEIEVIGKRSDANNSPSFSGKLLLAGNRTDTAVTDGKSVGTVLFGGNHTDGTVSNILYSASVGGVAEGDYTASTTMPTGLAFYTGSTGESSSTPNVRFGTERMRITAGGNVGIGTTDPTQALTIENGMGAVVGGNLTNYFSYSAYPTITGTYTGNYHGFFSGLSTSASNANLTQINGYTASSSLSVYKGDTNPLVTGFNSNVQPNPKHYNFYAYSAAANYFRGMILLGLDSLGRYDGTSPYSFVTTRDYGLRTVGTSSTITNSPNEGSVIWRSDTSSSWIWLFSGPTSGSNNNPVARGGIRVSNTATIFATSSDYRLKENVTPIADAAERVMKLKPSRFNFINSPGQTVDGFLAHEAQEVVPEAVTGKKDAVDEEGKPDHQGIDQSKLVPLLTAALQEALTEIDGLKARLNDAGL